MAQVLEQTTRTALDDGARTAQTPPLTISRPVPEGFRTWLPALFVLFCTPLLALVVTKYTLIPPMKRAAAQSELWAARAAAGQGTDALCFVKIPLTASGGKNAHSGFKSLALITADPAFKDIIEQSKAKLTTLAASEFKDTTVSDLDKPGALEAKRAQLVTDFNRALGDSLIQEIYIAEWPRQKP
jgi:hypothetical protein